MLALDHRLVAADEQNAMVDSHSDGENSDKLCGACSRGCKTGQSLVSPGEPLELGLVGGEGSYCGECSPPWRLELRDDVKLSFLASRLKDDHNRARYNIVQLAWLSLRKEGKDRVKRVVLQELIATLTWVMEQMGLMPSKFFFVKALGATTSPSTVGDGRRFITMVDAEGNEQIGYFEAMGMEPTDAVMVPRPYVEQRCFFGNTMLRTSLLEQAELFSKAASARPELPLQTQCVPKEASEVTSLTPQEQKSKKLLQEIDTKLLIGFNKEAWDRVVKESAFTPWLAKVLQIRQEAALLSDDAELLGELDRYARGMAAPKASLKKVSSPCQSLAAHLAEGPQHRASA